jgi:hypothetical protein
MNLQASDWNLFEWFKDNNKALGMTIVRPKLFQDALPQYSHIRARFTQKGHSYEGFSSSTSLVGAYNIACVEAVERWLVTSHRQNSNGFALHPIKEEAALRARLEVVERDAFFCHYLLGVPFVELDTKKLRLPNIDIKNLTRELKTLGLSFKLYRASPRAEAHAILSVVFGEGCRHPFGIRLGMGASIKSSSDAAQSALLESLRGAEYLGLSKKRHADSLPLSVSKFSKLKRPGPVQHAQLGVDLDYAKQFLETYLVTKGKRKPPRFSRKTPLKLSSIPVQFHKLNHPLLISCPIYSAKAEKRGFQDLFFGRTHVAHANLERLKEFAKANGIKVPRSDGGWNLIARPALTLPHPFP